MQGGTCCEVGCIEGKLVIGAFLTLVLEGPVVGEVQSVTKDEVVDPAATNCPSCFGRVVVVVHGSLDSLDARCDKRSGCGWK